MSEPSADALGSALFCCRIRATPVSSWSCPPSESSTFSPRATTTRITNTVSRLCSSTRRAFVGTKLTTGITAAFFHLYSSAATREPEGPCTLLRGDFQCKRSKNRNARELTHTNSENDSELYE